MRLIGYRSGTRDVVGVLFDDDRVSQITDIDDFYRDLPTWTAYAQRLRAGAVPRTDLAEIPAIRPSARILCVGLNYQAHAEEGGFAIPDYPTVFGRWTVSLAVNGTPVPVPVDEPGLDWEAEVAVVVGRELYQVDEQEAAGGILGYAAFNDLSARVAQRRTAQWTLGKNADHSGPIGPVVTADEAGDPAHGWRVATRVNGETVQDGDTKDMIFTVPRILAHISRTLTLHPGDVIATGTTAGVGHARKPPRFLHPGDVVEVEIDHLGKITNPITAR
jgi:2,4-didehydro-3-deoxy-L-rhamnonate hydrolase